MPLDRREFLGSMFALIEAARLKRVLSENEAQTLLGNANKQVFEYHDASEPKPAALCQSALAKVCWNPFGLEFNTGFRYLTKINNHRLRLYYHQNHAHRFTMIQSSSAPGSDCVVFLVREENKEYVEIEIFSPPYYLENHLKPDFPSFYVMSLTSNGAIAT